MDIKHLKYFIEIVQHKSMTAAASKLFLSQSTLSKAIRDLEKEFNTELFTRQNRQLILTDSGQLLYNQAIELIKIYDQLPNHLNLTDGDETGHIRFGLSTITDVDKFMNTFQAFHDAYPKITYHLTQGGGKTIENKVLNHQLDLGLTSLPVETHLFDYFPIYEEGFFIVLLNDHPLVQKEHVTISDLKDESFIVFNEEFYITDMIQAICRENGFVPHTIATISQWSIIEYLITSNIGITIVPDNIARSLSQHPSITIIPIEKEVISWKIGVIWKKGTYLNNVTKKWIDYLHLHLNV